MRRRQRPSRHRALRGAVLAAGCLAAATVPLLGAPPTSADAAPKSDQAPRATGPGQPGPEAADLYAFVSPDRPDTVTLISTWLSPAEENTGENRGESTAEGGQRGVRTEHRAADRLFATDAHYDINVDNDGDGAADRTYRWTFHDDTTPSSRPGVPHPLLTQRYTLEQLGTGMTTTTLVHDGRTAPADPAGPSTSEYLGLREQTVGYLTGGARMFAGPADDPSFQNLAALDSIGTTGADAPTAPSPRGDRDRRGPDLRAGHNVNVLALQVPKYWLARDVDATANPVIGVWSSAEVAAPSGGSRRRWTQVSRAGNPLMTGLLLPAGVGDTLRSQQPQRDPSVRALARSLAAPALPPLLRGQPAGAIPRAPREDLIEIYLTGVDGRDDGPLRMPRNSQLANAGTAPDRFVRSEQLRVNLSVPPTHRPNRLGLPGGDRQGYPNGRRLGDDVVDIQLQLLAGAARTGRLAGSVGAGDRVDGNDVAFGQRFPYVALPHPRALPQPPVAQADPTGPADTTPADGTARTGTSYASLVLALFGSMGLVLTATAGWMLHRLRRSEQDRPDPSERRW